MMIDQREDNAVPTTTASNADRILALRHRIASQFLEDDWQALGKATGCADLIETHERLGEMHWGDHGYDACVLHVLSAVAERDPGALADIEKHVTSVCGALRKEALSRATLVRP